MWLHKTMNCFQLVKSVLDELYEQVLLTFIAIPQPMPTWYMSLLGTQKV